MNTAQRAERGAQLLDHARPGWAMAVDLKALRMGDGIRCVLGQLHRGGYGPMLAELGCRDPYWLGFIDQPDNNQAHMELTNAWRIAITTRRTA